MKNSEKNMETIVALAKGRGFVYAGSEIYSYFIAALSTPPIISAIRKNPVSPG